MQQNRDLPRVLCLEILNTYNQDCNQNEVEKIGLALVYVSLLPLNLSCNQTL